MKCLRNFVSVLLVLVVCVLIAPPAKAGTTITQSTCPIIITQPGEYDLATDVGPCAPGTDGIDIRVSDVTLHLNGHNLVGSTDPLICNLSNGIQVGLPAPNPMLSQVHVLGNGTISNFRIGFLAENSAGSFVKFVTVTEDCTNTRAIGFLILGPGGQWKLQNNVVREPRPTPTGTGIAVFNLDDNDLVGNDVNNTIQFNNSNNNTIVHNSASDNGGGNNHRRSCFWPTIEQ